MIVAYTKTIFTYFAFAMLVSLGHISDQLAKIFHRSKYRKYFLQGNLYPIFTTFESFYIRRLYRRICDCWNRPVCSSPTKNITLVKREPHANNEVFTLTDTKMDVLNFSSYNYLGFAGKNNFDESGYLNDMIANNEDVVSDLPPAYIENSINTDLENNLAQFLHKEACAVFQMGYGTNSLNLPLIVQDSLILSDERNHTSLINGLKLTKGRVVIYKHNDFKDLEKKLKFHISQGMPETHRAWFKIFVVLEGIFSMEGSVPDLHKLIELKKKYKFYIYLDEAHSFGCLGKTGRGVCEMLNVDFDEIDIIMGTFTKTFNGYGGFITSTKEIIEHLKNESVFMLYSDPISPIVAKQIYINLLELQNNPQIVKDLNEKTKYMRNALKKKRFIVLGNENSPVIPLLICNPGKIAEFSRLCLSMGLAMVVVGYPATPLLLARTRICLSAAHTYEEIDSAVRIIDKIGKLLGIKK